MDMLPIRRAILSVTDKTGLVEFATFLSQNGVELVSTGGTMKALQAAGLPVTAVSDVTGFPEILGGRVKTLHPKIHGGILANKDIPEHMATLEEKEIKPFDLVCVNLYDFAGAVERKLSLEQAVEEIDIGGPCMIRAAAKNFHSILVLPGTKWYATAMQEMKEHDMKVSLDFRQAMASRAFEATSRYDALITSYLRPGINMFLHDIGYDKFDIALGDTLTEPQHWDDEPFEAIVSNPPYSIKWEGEDNATLINDPRFAPAGVLAPKSKADLAFILHSLSWLATDGAAAIVCFPGVMYRGGKERKIRKYLIDNNYVDCIIQLPDNLFFGTTIATCIMVLKKSKMDNTVLFIDASSECVKVTNSNKLTAANSAKILDAFIRHEDAEYFAKVVTSADIEAQDYNLSVSTYVELEDTREVVDIRELNRQIEEIVAREAVLRAEIDRIIAEIEG